MSLFQYSWPHYLKNSKSIDWYLCNSTITRNFSYFIVQRMFSKRVAYYNLSSNEQILSDASILMFSVDYLVTFVSLITSCLSLYVIKEDKVSNETLCLLIFISKEFTDVRQHCQVRQIENTMVLFFYLEFRINHWRKNVPSWDKIIA